tara:strand:- start:639 stop:827 length:189 start_codon:yes stop_codon:yes gene_type:complete
MSLYDIWTLLVLVCGKQLVKEWVDGERTIDTTSETSNLDQEDWVFIQKQPFTEPIWGKVVNK